MDNFTNAGLVALLERVIAEHDPDLMARNAIADPMKGAVVDAAGKAALVARVMARHGPGLVLVVGQHLHLANETPALTVLKHSATPRILAEKFMRLERYHHSSHRTAIEAGASGWICTRSSRGQPATPGENCLIAGLLLGLVMALGREGCLLHIGGSVLAPQDLSTAQLEAASDLATFRISWTPTGGDTIETPAQPVDDPTQGRISDRLSVLFATDLARSWKISQAARMLAVSERSLQRHLKGENRSYSSVLRRSRMHGATLLLVETTTSLAEIGYCCGYADQAHFQREFLRTTNTTPKEFRRINSEAEGLAGR